MRSHGYRENEEKMRQKLEGKEEKVVYDKKSTKSADKKQNKELFPCYDKGITLIFVSISNNFH